MKYGLLGRKLGHSFSQAIHKELGNYGYHYYERKASEIEELLSHKDLGGLNVTLPYKEEIMKYCHILTDRARAIGCVNTIYFNEENKLVGDNTDYHGFAYILDSLNIDVKDRLSLIIGNGATSKTVAAVLKDRGGNYIKLSRSRAPFISNMGDYREADLIINTTPLGMYPRNGESLVDLRVFTSLKGVIDVIYNPLLTRLLLDAKDLNIPCSNGLDMLVVQAARSAEIFMGKGIPDEILKGTIGKIRDRFTNLIVLSDMDPKIQSFARRLALEAGKSFIDITREVEKKAGMGLLEIVSSHGGDYLRHLEEDTIKEFGKESGLVILLSKEVFEREENHPHLIQNGVIYPYNPLLPISGYI